LRSSRTAPLNRKRRRYVIPMLSEAAVRLLAVPASYKVEGCTLAVVRWPDSGALLLGVSRPGG
jgi:hypothetical protein